MFQDGPDRAVVDWAHGTFVSLSEVARVLCACCDTYSRTGRCIRLNKNHSSAAPANFFCFPFLSVNSHVALLTNNCGTGRE